MGAVLLGRAASVREGIGSYVNGMTEFEEDRVRASYGAAKYQRLSRIKAEYDPDNVFHRNANIKPSLTRSFTTRAGTT